MSTLSYLKMFTLPLMTKDKLWNPQHSMQSPSQFGTNISFSRFISCHPNQIFKIAVKSYLPKISKKQILFFFFICMALHLLFVCQECQSLFLWMILTISSRSSVNITILCIEAYPNVTDRITHFLTLNPKNNVLSHLC